LNTLISEILPPFVALVASYFAVVWRQGWRWVLGTGAVGAVAAWLLMQWSDALNAQIWLGGLIVAIMALMVGVGILSGAVAQLIDALRPQGGSLAFRLWGLAVVVGGLTVFLLATA
jgi:hypothetical protein